ncbi:MAG: hypothetical protein JNL58_11825 [Planctomyces sp.]|nr:hypothetical protein [Planctomyces sp.]
MPKFRLSSSVLLSVLCFAGCADDSSTSETPPIRTAETPETPATETTSTTPNEAPSSDGTAADAVASEPTAAGGEVKSFEGMKFSVPSSFKDMPLSEMQRGIIAAKFGIPDAGEAVSFTLSVSGGTIEDNISRWKGQFSGGQPATQETLSTNAGEATVVRLQGNFVPGMGRPPESDWSMIGVIIPMAERNYYVKLTGPTDQIARAEDAFLAFCKSAGPE